MTPQEVRKTRLGNDYKQMLRLKGDVISWRALKGEAPYIEEYEITVNVRTITGINALGSPQYRNSSVVTVTIPAEYPMAAPKVIMRTDPKPFHPNWYTNKTWCYGTWFPSEALGDFVIRMVKTLQFDQTITNEFSPADSEANDWYKKNMRSGYFPSDTTPLPDPSGAFRISSVSFKVHTEEISATPDAGPPNSGSSSFRILSSSPGNRQDDENSSAGRAQFRIIKK